MRDEKPLREIGNGLIFYCRIKLQRSQSNDAIVAKHFGVRRVHHFDAARCGRVGAAGFLGMSAEVLLGTYGHHHPDFLHGAANAITSKHRVSVVESVVDLESARERRQKA
jgi:hypothetical protein